MPTSDKVAWWMSFCTPLCYILVLYSLFSCSICFCCTVIPRICGRTIFHKHWSMHVKNSCSLLCSSILTDHLAKWSKWYYYSGTQKKSLYPSLELWHWWTEPVLDSVNMFTITCIVSMLQAVVDSSGCQFARWQVSSLDIRQFVYVGPS